MRNQGQVAARWSVSVRRRIFEVFIISAVATMCSVAVSCYQKDRIASEIIEATKPLETEGSERIPPIRINSETGQVLRALDPAMKYIRIFAD